MRTVNSRQSTVHSFKARFVLISIMAAYCMLTTVSCFAISDNAGTKNGAFLKIPTDARGVVLGDASVAMAEGTDAIRWNPAALGSLETKEFSATHIQYYQDVHIENTAFAYPLGDSALAAQGFYLAPGSIDGRDVLGNQTGDVPFYDLVGSLTYARRIRTRADGMEILAGGTLKIVQEKIADQQFQNPAVDAGLLLLPWDNLKLGAAVRNLSTGKANFARELVGGASYTAFKIFTGAMALNYANDAPVRFSIAGEYRIPEFESAVRVGYRTHDNLDNSQDSDIAFLRTASLAGLKMGAGFNYRLPMLQSVELQLDYAMAPFGALGISHTITVKARW
jgi:hypothetical protein